MVGDALDTDTGHEQDSITQVSEFVTSAPPHETTTHKPQLEEADICHSRTLACEIIPENHYFIQTATVLPLRRMAHSTKLSRMASVADRPGVDKFTVRSTTKYFWIDVSTLSRRAERSELLRSLLLASVYSILA